MRVGPGHADHHRHPTGTPRPARAGDLDRLPPGARLARAARQEADAFMKEAGWLLTLGATLLAAGCGPKGGPYPPGKNTPGDTIPAGPPTPTHSRPAQPAPPPHALPPP